MKLRLLLFAALFIAYAIQGFSQVKVETQDVGNDVIFNATSNEYGTYTLVLTLTTTGYKSPLGTRAVIGLSQGYNSSIYRLEREEGQSASYRYNYRFYKGKYHAKPVKEYPYLLPAKAGTDLRISKLTNLNHTIGKTDKRNDSILGLVFNYKDVDTIYAIRSGYVTKIEGRERDRIKSEQGGQVIYDKPSRSKIEIEHKDGTMVRYICLTAGKSLLEPGDRVIAGQPIAVFIQEEKRPSLGIGFSYLDRDFKYKTIIPQFYTSEGLKNLEFNKQYQSATTKDIIEKELTKKEKKARNSK